MASTLSLGAFMAEFPEFADAEDDLVAARLAQAHRLFSEEILGDRYLDAVRYKTADLIAASPFGKSLRLEKGNGPSIYAETLADILAGTASRVVVVSSC